MIRRNQAMRAGTSSSGASGSGSGSGGGGAGGGRASSGQRKSSFGKRGNRASASFGEGRASAPHETIPTAEFHRHVESDLPEAVRMRHLLVFLGKRLADGAGAKGKGKADEGPRERLVRETKDEVLRALIAAKCDTNPCGGHKVRPPSAPWSRARARLPHWRRRADSRLLPSSPPPRCRARICSRSRRGRIRATSRTGACPS